MRLALVEDNLRLAGLLAKGLGAAGFTVDSLATGADASTAISTIDYDAMILDLGLPDIDGITLLKNIRSAGHKLPILILTARDGIGDRVLGLDAGADDYVLKPFMIDEVSARLRALLRRPSQSLDTILSVGNLSFNTVTRQASVNDEAITMTRRESELLHSLLRRAGNIVSRSALEEHIYGFEDEVTPNSIEVIISRLRKALRRGGSDVEITTFRNLGYMLSKVE